MTPCRKVARWALARPCGGGSVFAESHGALWIAVVGALGELFAEVRRWTHWVGPPSTSTSASCFANETLHPLL